MSLRGRGLGPGALEPFLSLAGASSPGRGKNLKDEDSWGPLRTRLGLVWHRKQVSTCGQHSPEPACDRK